MVDIDAGGAEVSIVFISVAKTQQMTNADWISLNDKIAGVLKRFNARIGNGWNDDGRISHCWQAGIWSHKEQQIRTLLEAIAAVFSVDIMWAKADVTTIKGT